MIFRRKLKYSLKLFLIICSCLLIALRLYAVLINSSRGETVRGTSTLVPQPNPLTSLFYTGIESVREFAPVNSLGGGEPQHLEGTERIERPGNLGGVGPGVLEVVGGEEESKRAIAVDDSLSNLGRRTQLNDIFISVKTTAQFHRNRVDLLLRTWFQLATDQIFFFTDVDDAELSRRTNGHVINTNCSAIHSREALCCKMSFEYNHFIKSASKYRWFCHVDDDNYVNVPSLVQLLQQYNHVEDWYIGRPSLNHALEILDPDNEQEKVSFWFATGGAGFCISRGLALKMMPFTINGRLQSTCGKIRLPDDCTIAFILYNYLGVELTQVHRFHSHLEPLKRMKTSTLRQQITFSYSGMTNVVGISGFNEMEDPSRFLSIHCFLFPNSIENCP